MSSATRWYAQYQYANPGFEPTHTMLCIMPCTVDQPVLIPGWRMVGRVRPSQAEVINDVIDFLVVQKSTLSPVVVELTPQQVLEIAKGKR